MKCILLLALCGACLAAQYGNRGPPGPPRRLKVDSEEFDTQDDDYDYKYEEIKIWKPAPNKNIQPFTSQMYSTYNKANGQHFYHANKRIWQKKQKSRGFISEQAVANILPCQVYERQRTQLSSSCGDLVELFYLSKDGCQFLTTSKDEKRKKIQQGWRDTSSVGYCVQSRKSGTCGASKPLYECKKEKFGRTLDYFYTTDRNEYTKQLKRGEYVDTKRDVICYLW